MDLLIKNRIITELIVSSMPIVFNIGKILDKLLEESFTENCFLYKIKTKTHHVIFFMEENGSGSSNFLIIKPRNILKFLKPWSILEKKDMPEILADEIFDLSCDVNRRKTLIQKVLKLRAFW